MSQLPTLGWNPSAVLKIITASNDISCAGTTQKGLPCRWDLGGEPKLQARNLLNSMSQRSPREALDVLPQLARLCLCQKNHQQQAASLVARWTSLIEPYASSLEREDTRQTHRPVGHGGSAGGMSSNGRVHTRPSPQKPNVNDIIAELEALSIRREELMSMLQDADPGDEHKKSEDRSARTSPSQNTAHLVLQTQPSEPESSRAGQGQRRGLSSSRDGWKGVFGRGKQPN
jgi:hypothetical protein